MKYILNLIYEKRIYIGIGIIFLYVVFNLNGSSIYNWNYYFADGETYGNVIIGTPRHIRSDEWQGIQAMMASQDANGYSYYNCDMRATETDAYISFNLPVKDYAIIFRPFYIGFLLFGYERGNSFLWSARVVCLFLLSLEFANRILKAGYDERNKDTSANRLFSLAFALMIAFSSMYQWWSCSPEFWELMLSIVLFDEYFKCKKSWKKQLLFSFLICWSAGCLGMYLYPAWIIPVGYIILVFVIWILARNWKAYKWTKRDIFIWLIPILWLFGSLFYIYCKSKTTIDLMLNTSYPGQRSITGGSVNILQLFIYCLGVFLPGDENTTVRNVCESSTFYCLFPIDLFFAGLAFQNQLKKHKKLDLMLVLLVIVSTLFTIYQIVGFPEWLAKITLLSHSTGNRVWAIWGLSELLILFRTIWIMKCEEHEANRAVVVGISVCSMVIAVCARLYDPEYVSVKRMFILALILWVYSILIYLWILKKKYMKYGFPIMAFALSFLCGMRVNPIQQGMTALTGHALYKEIASIAETDGDGIWFVTDIGTRTPITNVPVAAGAREIDCTNYYPNLELWEKVDPTNKYYDDYNRYANMIGYIQTESDTYFEGTADRLTIWLNPEDFETLGVDYLLSGRDLGEFSLDTYGFEEYKQVAGDFYIYRRTGE